MLRVNAKNGKRDEIAKSRDSDSLLLARRKSITTNCIMAVSFCEDFDSIISSYIQNLQRSKILQVRESEKAKRLARTEPPSQSSSACDCNDEE